MPMARSLNLFCMLFSNVKTNAFKITAAIHALKNTVGANCRLLTL